jgi:hypothetical protein
MLVKIGESFEVEVRGFTLYVRVGRRAVFLSRGDCAFDLR